jgi:hypothetical protein
MKKPGFLGLHFLNRSQSNRAQFVS